MTPDQINGVMVLVGSAFVVFNIVKLYRDKELKGAHWAPVAFFMSMNYWGMYFFSQLDQWWSFAGVVGMSVTHTIWLGQIFYYTRKRRMVQSTYVEF